MNDPRAVALETVSRWLDTARRRPLAPGECAALVDALGLVQVRDVRAQRR